MIALMIVIIGIAMRLVPHPANVAPVAAIALFAGTYLNKKWALWVPLVIMMISDLVIGLHDVVAFTWGSFVLVALLGTWLKQHKNIVNVGVASVAASVLFFMITNFGVWLAWYPTTLQGLTQCYTLALPFYRNTLIGDLLYVVVFFGIYECAARLVKNTRYAYLTS
jgi:hypothetical protein